MAEVANKIAEVRRQRGYSAIQLAAMTSVSRQTIYAIESGTYVPNTAVALRLARALDSTVEELFALPEAAEKEPHFEAAELLPDAQAPRPGQPVQLCRVDRKLIATAVSPVSWNLPQADGVVTSQSSQSGKTSVRAFESGEKSNSRILVAGCDPGFSVLARHAQAAGVELVLAHRNSSQALSLLKSGSVHVAGTHLRDEATGESNLPQVNQLFTKDSTAVISFAVWEEGIITAAGNPKSIRGVEDFAREDICIVNREEGAGSRNLLDSLLRRLDIPESRVRGYDSLASGHLSAAWHVDSGAADCCIATRAAARVFGLDFIPLLTERYDLAIRKRHLNLPGVQMLFDTLTRAAFRRELEGLGGYDARAAGDRLL